MHLGKKARAIVPDLLAMTRDTDARVRANAGQALRSVAPEELPINEQPVQSSWLFPPESEQTIAPRNLVPVVTRPNPVDRSLGNGVEFSEWLSNHAGLSLDGRR